MDKLMDGEADYAATFEQTLQQFVGLSSEEIWELQRVLIRRVRCKISESLSPEGRTAMKEAKEDMLEYEKVTSSTTLVTELYTISHQDDKRRNGETVNNGVSSNKRMMNGKRADDKLKGKHGSSNDNDTMTDVIGTLQNGVGDEIDKVSVENGLDDNEEGNQINDVKVADDNQNDSDDRKTEADVNVGEMSSGSQRPGSRSSSKRNGLSTGSLLQEPDKLVRSVSAPESNSLHQSSNKEVEAKSERLAESDIRVDGKKIDELSSDENGTRPQDSET